MYIIYLYIIQVKWVKLLSHVWLFAIPWTVVYQASLSMGFSKQEYWSGLPFPSPGDLPEPGIEPRSPALQADSLPSEECGSRWIYETCKQLSVLNFFSSRKSKHTILWQTPRVGRDGNFTPWVTARVKQREWRGYEVLLGWITWWAVLWVEVDGETAVPGTASGWSPPDTRLLTGGWPAGPCLPALFWDWHPIPAHGRLPLPSWTAFLPSTAGPHLWSHLCECLCAKRISKKTTNCFHAVLGQVDLSNVLKCYRYVTCSYIT